MTHKDTLDDGKLRAALPTILRESRIELGLSQTEIGELCGMTRKRISKYETGAAIPDLVAWRPIC